MHPADLAKTVAIQLRDRGFQAFLVGGCVRDLLLNVSPKDYDVATDARPDQVQALFPDANLVGAHFGVVLVREDDAQVEVATFRSEGAYNDARRPSEVRFESDPRLDVLRRDFTINALLMDPQSGQVLDFVNGRADLTARVIRAIGDPEQRFAEDHLRLLRAVRFAARLRFTIEPATMGAIQRGAESILTVSAERVRDEITRILTEGGARYGFELLDETGLLAHILPEIAAMKGVQQPPQFHPEGDVWTHTLIMLGELDHPTAALALGVLLHDVGKPPTFRIADRIRFDGHVEAGVTIAGNILNRLRFSGDEIRQVQALVANHMRFSDLKRMKESTLRRFLRLPEFQEHLELHRLDCLSSHRQLENYDLARAKLAERPPEILKPVPLVTGDDLIRAGYQPGPRFGEMLSLVEEAQLESNIHSREEALAMLQSRFPPGA